MRNILKGFIRMSSFVRKEIFEILRQPRLLLTLVLGPFLILLIFGIGYRGEARALRTLFVANPNSPLGRQIEEFASTLGEQLVFMGVTNDQAVALERLRANEVDVVAVAPADAYEKIRASEPAVFTLYHSEIDPFQVDYVNYFGQVYIDEVNRRLLLRMTQQGQQDAASVQDDLQAAKGNAASMRQALQAGDQVTARQQQTELAGNVDSLSLAVGATLGVLSGVQETMGGDESEADTGSLLAALTGLQENTDALEQTNATPDNSGERIERISEIERDLDELDTQLEEFTNIDANVLVRPFRSEAQSIATIQPEASDFFAPAVIALLLQHLAVTFAALSIVRERTVGTMELFRVSPLAAGETLFGKYLSYMLFGGVITLALTLLMVYVLGVPMLGNWWDYALVITVLLFTSLGFGFVISLLAQTDSQAVQFTMIMLLTSVFFSGFLMSLDMIWQPVRALSWALPTTYGVILLRDIFLRGNPADYYLIGGLALIGVGLLVLAWILLRRLIHSG